MLLTREQLQERLISLHRASIELVKDVSLESLLERIASIACKQVDARFAALGVLDHAGKLKQFIHVGLSAEEIKRIAHTPRGQGLIGVLMQSKDTIRLKEISEHQRSVGFPDGHPEMHSFLGVPIRVGEKQLGQIYLTEKIGGAEFSEDDEKIIEMLAAYAAAAIQNAQLYDDLRNHDQELTQRNKDLALLNKIAAALASSLDMDEILNNTLALVISHFKVEASEIFISEEDGKTQRLELHRGEAAEAFWTRNRFRSGEGAVGKAVETKRPVIIQDLSEDGRFLRDAVIQEGFRKMICIPLTARDNIVGVLSIASRDPSPFRKNEIQLLSSVGAWVGVAIENARLHYNARRLAILEERERIGMDLHDGVIQSIYGVGLALENIRLLLREDIDQVDERILKAIDGLNSTIRDIRTYILDLRPRQMLGENIMDGLQRLAAEFKQNAKAEITLSGPKNELLLDLPRANAMALFHTCQEALANVAKYANASKVTVHVWTSADRLLLEVQDDGMGFIVDEISKTVGHGLANMRTRIHNVGGDLDVTSSPGNGTTILAWVPRILVPREA